MKELSFILQRQKNGVLYNYKIGPQKTKNKNPNSLRYKPNIYAT